MQGHPVHQLIGWAITQKWCLSVDFLLNVAVMMRLLMVSMLVRDFYCSAAEEESHASDCSTPFVLPGPSLLLKSSLSQNSDILSQCSQGLNDAPVYRWHWCCGGQHLQPSGLAYRTQVLVLAAECGFESRPWHLCPWARRLIIIASLHPGVKWVPVRAELVD